MNNNSKEGPYKTVWLNKEEVRIGTNQLPHQFPDNKVTVLVVNKQEEKIDQKKSKIKFNVTFCKEFNFLLNNNDEDRVDELFRFKEFFKKISASQNNNYFIIFAARGKWFTKDILQQEIIGKPLLDKFICVMGGLFNYYPYQFVNDEDQSVAFIYDNNEKKCFEPKKENNYMHLKYIKFPDKTICDSHKAKVHKIVGWCEDLGQLLKEMDIKVEKKQCCFIQCGSNAQLSNGNKRIKKVGTSGWNCGALGDLNCHHYKIKIITPPSGGLMIGFAQKSKFIVNGPNYSSGFGWYLYGNGGKYSSSNYKGSSDSIGSNINKTSGTIIEVKYNSKKETISYIINGQNYENVFTNVKDTGDICPAFDICNLNIEFEFIDL
ncbi:hypothetical protein ABK040_008529 [Willaertia magna]